MECANKPIQNIDVCIAFYLSKCLLTNQIRLEVVADQAQILANITYLCDLVYRINMINLSSCFMTGMHKWSDISSLTHKGHCSNFCALTR